MPDMKTRFCLTSVFCAASVLLMFVPTSRADGFRFITGPVGAIISDLVGYDENGKAHVILKPGDGSDDITVPAHHSLIIEDVGFIVQRFEVSVGSGGVDIPERETMVGLPGSGFRHEIINPHFVIYFQAVGTDTPLISGIDPGDYDSPNILVGTTFDFVNGESAAIPGLFLAHNIDFTDGSISDLFTGQARLISRPFSVALLAPDYDPSTSLLLCLSLGTILSAKAIWSFAGRAKHRRIRSNPKGVAAVPLLA